MQITFKKFVKLTALLAAAGTVVPACSATDDDSEDSTGGRAGSSEVPDEPTAGAAGETERPEGEGGMTSQGGSAGDTAAGVAGKSAGVAGKSAGVAGEAAGGFAGEGSTDSRAGAAGDGGAGACIPAGDPAAEGEMGIDCTQLSNASETCDSPSGEGGSGPYAVQLCNVYAYEPQAAAQLLFECLDELTAPADGWCGDAHLAQADDCLAQVEQQTCSSSAAETACASINTRCSDVSVQECVADLSPRSETFVAGVEPCMEGFGSVHCALDYRACLGLPERYVETAGVCETLVEGCSALTSDACAGALDASATGYVYENAYLSIEACMADAVEQGTACEEAFTTCVG